MASARTALLGGRHTRSDGAEAMANPPAGASTFTVVRGTAAVASGMASNVQAIQPTPWHVAFMLWQPSSQQRCASLATALPADRVSSSKSVRATTARRRTREL